MLQMEKVDECYLEVKRITINTKLLWKKSRGIVSDSVADKMDLARLDWIVELTDALDIWIKKNEALTAGELILARTNLGALVECWLQFFYCAYYEDYLKNPKLKKNRIIEPNKMSFEELKRFSIGILWEDEKDPKYLWVHKIQYQRNAIHAFNYRDIGTAREFLDDICKFYEFLDAIDMRMPPIEEYIECYPAGYIWRQY